MKTLILLFQNILLLKNDSQLEMDNGYLIYAGSNDPEREVLGYDELFEFSPTLFSVQ